MTYAWLTSSFPIRIRRWVRGGSWRGNRFREGVQLRRWEASNELKSFVPLKGDDIDREMKESFRFAKAKTCSGRCRSEAGSWTLPRSGLSKGPLYWFERKVGGPSGL